jgi:hypothetical protein
MFFLLASQGLSCDGGAARFARRAGSQRFLILVAGPDGGLGFQNCRQLAGLPKIAGSAGGDDDAESPLALAAVPLSFAPFFSIPSPSRLCNLQCNVLHHRPLS